MTFPQINSRYSDITSMFGMVSTVNNNGYFSEAFPCNVTSNLTSTTAALTEPQTFLTYPYYLSMPLGGHHFYMPTSSTIGGMKRSIQDFPTAQYLGSTFSIDADPNESKKSKLEVSTNTEPSRVLHIRNIASRAQESDITLLAVPFGKIRSMVFARKTNQALLEMQEATEATRMFDYYTTYPPCLNGKDMIIQYSKHSNLELKLQNSNIEACIETANKMVQDHRQKMKEWEIENKSERRILRVVIENLKDYNISHLVIFKVFQRFGKVHRIIIFTKNMQCQCLVELDSTISVHVALLQLNGQDLFPDCCRLRVEFSKNTDSLQIQRQNDKCRDYITNPLQEEEQILLGLLDSQKCISQKIPADPAVSVIQPFASLSSFTPKSFVNDSLGLNNLCFTMLPFFTTALQTQSVLPDSLFAADCAINLNSQENMLKTPGEMSSLMIRNVSSETVDTDSLFTLFGVYGDVLRVCILPALYIAIVSMTTAQQAETAAQLLNGVPLGGKNISITVVSNDWVDLTISNCESCLQMVIKDFRNTLLHRFKKPNSKNHYNIYPPNMVLHLSNIPLNFEEKDLKQLFQNCGFICNSLKMFHRKDKKMALVKMNSVDEAVSALISMHNLKLSDSCHLRVSFSKATI